MRALLIPAALLLGGCAAMPAGVDDCGYTWRQVRAPADLVTVTIDPDTRRWPGICASPFAHGCTSWRPLGGGRWMAEIRLREMPRVATPCSPLRHEFEHALGRDHDEATAHIPRDYTR